MSTTTTNYNLVKPELTDAADITAMNQNWDTIDTMLKNLANEGWLTPVTTENQNLDNYVTQGIYSFDSAYAPINRPDGNSNGWLIVIPWNNTPGVGTVKQLWLRHGALNSNDHCLYVRTRISSDNAWSTWAQIYTTKDITVNLADINALGTTIAQVNNIGNALDKKAPINHASSSDTYGKGTDTNYGHVKLSNSTTSTSGTSGGTAATPAAVKAAKDAIVRPNLLDNWYFVGGGSQQGGGQFPINQRGQTRYTTEGYTIDRWRTWGNVTLEIASDGIALSNSGDTNGLFCNLENWEVADGTPVTLSALFAGNKLITVTGVSASQIDIATPRLEDGVYANFYRATNTTHVSIRLPTSASAKVRAIKLELGDTQTLAHQENGKWVLNEIPNYTEQLLRCSRGEQIDGADSGATLPLYRQEAFVSSDTVPAINGAINWTYV